MPTTIRIAAHGPFTILVTTVRDLTYVQRYELGPDGRAIMREESVHSTEERGIEMLKAILAGCAA